MTRSFLVGLAVLAASKAQALPLTGSLAVPRLSFELLFGQTPPPVAIPDAPVTPPPTAAQLAAPPPAPWIDGQDHIRLHDGRELKGKILSQVQDGFLFSDQASNSTYVVAFKDIADLQRAGAQSAPPSFSPSFQPGLTAERRFFLEQELRTLQSQYEAVSVWPGIEELAAGVIGVGLAIVLLAVFGTSDAVDLVFAILPGVTGIISLIFGTVSLVSAENRKAELSGQIAKAQDQLSRLPPLATLLSSPPMVAFRF